MFVLMYVTPAFLPNDKTDLQELLVRLRADVHMYMYLRISNPGDTSLTTRQHETVLYFHEVTSHTHLAQPS